MKYIKIEELAYVSQKGKSITKDDKGDFYAVAYANIEDGKIDFSKTLKCNLPNAYMDLKMYDIAKDDIILPPITRKNLIIKQLKEIEKQSNMIYSSRAVCIRTNPDIYNAKFLYHLLSTEKYRNKLLNEVYNNGSYPDTYQISTVRLKKFKVPNIPIEEQKKILEKENKITMQIDKLQKELFALYDKI
ncbi:MAG: hypothetical protein ACLSW4_04490 [Clostridia bacterium]